MFEAPQSLNWSFTYRCNFNCSHCYSRAPTYPDELSNEQYAVLTSNIISAQVFRVGFGGGEPLVRDDFVPTIERLSSAGIDTHFTTNGWLIDSELALRLRGSGLGMIAISLDSADESAHDRLRNRRGSFRRAVSAIRLMAGGDTQVTVSCTVHKGNLAEVHQVVALGTQLGANEVNLKVFRPAGNGLILSDKLALGQEDIDLLRLTVDELNSIYAGAITFYGPESQGGCSCGTTTLTLRPNGDVAICPYGESILGNLTRDDLREVWLTHPALVHRRRVESACIGKSENRWPLGGEISETAQGKYIEKVRSRWDRQASLS